jgi:hypothetical protein
MRRIFTLVILASLIAGAISAPAVAQKKRKPRAPIATDLYLHGTQAAGEMESFVPIVHEDLLTMDATPPTSQEKSKQITNYSAGPNTQCAGNNLFPAWIGEASGKVVGDIKFVFTSVGSPGLVDIKVWADIPGGTDFCNDGYVEPNAQALAVALPAGEADVEAILEGTGFNVTRTLLIQISPSTMDVGGTQRPGSNVFFSRIEYDSEGHASALSFSCLPPSRKASCTT